MAVQIVSRTKRDLGEIVLGTALGMLGGNPDKNARYFLKAINRVANGERGEMVREWVQGWYGRYEESGARNPSGPASGTYRVYRGGGFFHFVGKARR